MPQRRLAVADAAMEGQPPPTYVQPGSQPSVVGAVVPEGGGAQGGAVASAPPRTRRLCRRLCCRQAGYGGDQFGLNPAAVPQQPQSRRSYRPSLQNAISVAWRARPPRLRQGEPQDLRRGDRGRRVLRTRGLPCYGRRRRPGGRGSRFARAEHRRLPGHRRGRQPERRRARRLLRRTAARVGATPGTGGRSTARR